MPEQPKIFLSYAREDRERVEEVYDALKQEGYSPWIDVRDIRGGERWSDVIGKSIRTADLMMMFISKNSVSKRGYFQTELRAALSVLSERPPGDVFIVPIRLDDSEPPQQLSEFQFVDLFGEAGWKRLRDGLKAILKSKGIATETTDALREEIRKREQEAAEQGKKRPDIFVAMPFAVEWEDVFHFGIAPAIDVNGFDPIRIDKSAFTGDILDRIRTSIENSAAAVIELTGLNPNVHLELGYAWGNNVPTILVIKKGSELCFDVRGQKCLEYETIKELQEKLTSEIGELKKNGGISSK